MGAIRCFQCGKARNISNSAFHWPPNVDILKGVLICGDCKTSNVFEMTGDHMSYLPGALFATGYLSTVPSTVRELINEAAFCFYGTAYRGAVAMCRSAVEEALEQKGISGGSLFAKIENAETHGVLGDEQIALAHSARLSGRSVLHRGATVTQPQGLAALNATLDLVNHISQQPQVLATQSETDNSAQ